MEKENFVYYGTDLDTQKDIYIDRHKESSPIEIICGTHNSGKDFIAQHEIMQVLSSQKHDQVFIIDTAGEYKYLTNCFDGQYIVFDETLENCPCINPFEKEENCDFRNDFCDFRNDLFIFCLFENIANRNLTAKEKSVIFNVYEKIMAGSKQPTIHQFIEELERFTDKNLKTEKETIYKLLYPYKNLKFINDNTNIDINKKLVIFDVSKCSDLYNIMYIVCANYINQLMHKNNGKSIYSWVYFTDMDFLFHFDETINFIARIFKTSRAYRGIVTGIQQDVKEMVCHNVILNNAGIVICLSQTDENREIIKNIFSLPEEYLKYIHDRLPGEGLLFQSSGFSHFRV